VGGEARYVITRGQSLGARWSVQVGENESIDCTGDPRFRLDARGMTILRVPGQWSHRRITVLAGDKARWETRIAFEPKVVADSWTLPASRGHKPGEGDDFLSGDFDQARYQALGDRFRDDYDRKTGQPKKNVYELFGELRKLVQHLTTRELKTNADKMVATFQENNGEWRTREYSDAVLTKCAREHAATRKFVAAVRDRLAQALANAAGDAARLEPFTVEKHPAFNEKTDYITGLTIAINDTWAFEVTLADYEMTGSSSYKARLKIVLYDHFGLDAPDITGRNQSRATDGFRAWFMLQHVHGYRPFITRIEFDENVEDRF
jgi:hypothetical protein